MQKILIIEDEPTLGKIYREQLARAGYGVKLATTVEDALVLGRTFAADLILLDHGLPESDKDGIDSIPDIRAVFPKAKIVLFSNYSMFELKEKALAAGAEDYWLKLDLKLDELADRIAKLFR
ncbi:MAG: response regulator [Patescibacteria group bacterium]